MKKVRENARENLHGPLRHGGFTLVELLVVIGIIIILIGISLPVIKQVRLAAYGASTENEISVITNAISQYYTTFNAYPGPLGDDQLCVPGAVTQYGLSIRPTEITPPYYPDANPAGGICGSENLVLGLMGGLALDTSGDGYLLWFNKNIVGQGPSSLNKLNPRHFDPFLQPPASWLSSSLNPLNLNPTGNGEFLDQAGRWCGDTNIPKFIDQFPDPLPIIYVRARRAHSEFWTARAILIPPRASKPCRNTTSIRSGALRFAMTRRASSRPMVSALAFPGLAIPLPRSGTGCEESARRMLLASPLTTRTVTTPMGHGMDWRISRIPAFLQPHGAKIPMY